MTESAILFHVADASINHWTFTVFVVVVHLLLLDAHNFQMFLTVQNINYHTCRVFTVFISLRQFEMKFY